MQSTESIFECYVIGDANDALRAANAYGTKTLDMLTFEGDGVLCWLLATPDKLQLWASERTPMKPKHGDLVYYKEDVAERDRRVSYV